MHLRAIPWVYIILHDCWGRMHPQPLAYELHHYNRWTTGIIGKYGAPCCRFFFPTLEIAAPWSPHPQTTIPTYQGLEFSMLIPNSSLLNLWDTWNRYQNFQALDWWWLKCFWKYTSDLYLVHHTLSINKQFRIQILEYAFRVHLDLQRLCMRYRDVNSTIVMDCVSNNAIRILTFSTLWATLLTKTQHFSM